MAEPLDLYARMSEAEDTLGVDRQLESLHRLAEKMGRPVGRVFVDNAFSATKGKRRPAFEALLKSDTKGVAVWHIDRLVRTSRDLERVIALGVNVHAVESSHIDLSNPAGRATARTITAWATYEGEQKALRQQLANAQRASHGRPHWGARPFGYERDGTIIPAEARALKKAYRQFLAGMSLRSICRELNAAGHTTSRGNPWDATALRLCLAAPRNAGILVYRGQEVGPGQWKGIVPEDVVRAAQRLLALPERRTEGGGARKHLMSGVAVCAACEGPVKTGWRGGRKGAAGAYVVYTCQRGQCFTHRQEWLDDFMRGLVLVRVVDVLDGRRALASSGVEGGLEDARAEVVRLRAKLAEADEDYSEDRITREQFLRISDRLNAKLAEAERARAALRDDGALSRLMSASDPEREWDTNMTVDQRREAIEMLVERVALRPRGKARRDMRPEDVEVKLHGE